MRIRSRRATSSRLCLGLAILAVSGTALRAADPVGVWTMSQDGTARQCRLQFRDDPIGTGRAIAMPPGCRHAFPILNGVRSWVSVDDAHVALDNDAEAAVLLFEDDGTGTLHALGPEGASNYTLKPLGGPRQAVVAPETPPDDAAKVVVVARPPVRDTTLTMASVAGHYAVMRGTRDTGCMVTLDEPGKSSAATVRARLAPACRDQGIIVFDPVGWQLKAGRLVLTARRGHTTDLERDEAGVWIKDGKAGQALGLKRL